MDLRLGDCLEVMKELDDDSVDLLFADLPYAQTACKWDALIDMEQFWKEANRVCKGDAAMVFTCSVKFGNTLINSNPKNFRYDLVWVKSNSVGFLNAKQMPMRKHEMVYIFYNERPKIYTENISLHHKHKFRDGDKTKPSPTTGLYGDEKKKVRHLNEDGTINQSLNQVKYDPPLPKSVIKEDEQPKYTQKSKRGQYGNITPYTSYGVGVYKPPLPTSVIKEEENKGENVYIDNCNSQLYGDLKRDVNRNKKEHQKIYDPPLPNSILEVKSEKGKHATQKPVALMEWVLKYYSRENDVVLDPTMGSGSTGVACKNMNRLFIGIEKDEEIYEVAFERLVE